MKLAPALTDLAKLNHQGNIVGKIVCKQCYFS